MLLLDRSETPHMPFKVSLGQEHTQAKGASEETFPGLFFHSNLI
jgi:hypothetical protein